MIQFENKGLIDLKTISTFGVSVKEGENPIGMFGTGLIIQRRRWCER